jgi:methyl-accepting chemotaxis protein
LHLLKRIQASGAATGSGGERREVQPGAAQSRRSSPGQVADWAQSAQGKNGNRVAEQAGGAMLDTVRVVGRASSKIAETASASGEVSLRIPQEGEAVGQLDQVVRQSVALVEESAVAGEGLHIQAGQLWELATSFRFR